MTLSEQTQATLATLNTAAALWHCLLAVVLVSVVATVGSPFTLNLTKHYRLVDIDRLPNDLQTPQCTNLQTNETKNFTDVFEYLRCVAPLSVPVIDVHEPFDTIRIWLLLLIFEVVTAFSHFRLAIKRESYYDMLELRLQPARWREYAITNSLMLVSILSLSGISELYLVLHIVLCAIFMNYCGGLVYELFTAIEQTHALDAPYANLVREAKTIVLALAWAAFILSLAYLFDIFNRTTSAYDELPTGFLWNQLFEIIFVLNVGITVCYSAFPMLHVLQSCSHVSYVRIEIGYILASLIAKSFLTIVVMVATIQRS